jgi:resuscitation-promoting factor RpfB
MTVVICVALAIAGAPCARGGHAHPPPVRGGHAVIVLPTTPRDIGEYLAAQRGWIGEQFSCLDTLWGRRESGWDPLNVNPSSGAGGIPQALPESKMASYGSDYRWNPWTQIRWGLSYIAARYGSPCNALAHSYAYNYY